MFNVYTQSCQGQHFQVACENRDQLVTALQLVGSFQPDKARSIAYSIACAAPSYIKAPNRETVVIKEA